MKLAINLRTLMRQRELTSKRLANEVGIPEGTLKTWLAGSAPRSLADVKTVAKHLMVSFEFLIFGDEETLQAQKARNKTYQVLLRLRIDALSTDNNFPFALEVLPEKMEAP